jgi:hypothetical protein
LEHPRKLARMRIIESVGLSHNVQKRHDLHACEVAVMKYTDFVTPAKFRALGLGRLTFEKCEPAERTEY